MLSDEAIQLWTDLRAGRITAEEWRRRDDELVAEGRRRQRAEMSNTTTACWDCGTLVTLDALVGLGLDTDGIPVHRTGWRCASCAEAVRVQYERTCDLCGAAYLAKRVTDYLNLCSTCWTPRHSREVRRVRFQLARATAAGLPATLTLRAWVVTLDAFQWRCAYCQTQAIEEMDHFIPLSAGGGTTADNCIPACAACNMKKRSLHPNDADALLSMGAIERIRAYLTAH